MNPEEIKLGAWDYVSLAVLFLCGLAFCFLGEGADFAMFWMGR